MLCPPHIRKSLPCSFFIINSSAFVNELLPKKSSFVPNVMFPPFFKAVFFYLFIQLLTSEKQFAFFFSVFFLKLTPPPLLIH